MANTRREKRRLEDLLAGVVGRSLPSDSAVVAAAEMIHDALIGGPQAVRSTQDFAYWPDPTAGLYYDSDATPDGGTPLLLASLDTADAAVYTASILVATGRQASALSTQWTGDTYILTGNNASTQGGVGSGYIYINTGDATGAGGIAGNIEIGAGTGATGGDVSITSGTSTAGVGGTVRISGSGGSGTYTGGSVEITTAASGAHESANINIETGVFNGAGAGGGITLKTGAPGGGGTRGAITLDAREITLTTQCKITNLATPVSGNDAANKGYVDGKLVFSKQNVALVPLDITHQYVDLAHLVTPNSLDVLFYDERQMLAEAIDYTLSTVAGVTRVTFTGDYATGQPSALVNGNTLVCKYMY